VLFELIIKTPFLVVDVLALSTSESSITRLNPYSQAIFWEPIPPLRMAPRQHCKNLFGRGRVKMFLALLQGWDRTTQNDGIQGVCRNAYRSTDSHSLDFAKPDPLA
jgi:hypothetical protein